MSSHYLTSASSGGNRASRRSSVQFCPDNSTCNFAVDCTVLGVPRTAIRRPQTLPCMQSPDKAPITLVVRLDGTHVVGIEAHQIPTEIFP